MKSSSFAPVANPHTGLKAVAMWTTGKKTYFGECQVMEINPKTGSLLVYLTEDVYGLVESKSPFVKYEPGNIVAYPKGHEIILPGKATFNEGLYQYVQESF
jgi:hypothetical protein